MAALPSGTVTFLFTDVEGSTRLLDELGAERYAALLAEHRRAVREAVVEHGGVEIDTQGDGFFIVFSRATDAVAAAVRARDACPKTVLVRMGIHTGEPLLTHGGYVGMDVHRAARIAAIGHGGQILVSQSTRELVGGEGLRDLGEHRLKDLTHAERIWQVGHADFPSLRSLHRTRLPIAATPLIGREPELARIERELRSGVRLLSVTGAGGSGKTRLALQAAADLTEEFPGGTYFVPLAPLAEAASMRAAVAAALELQPDDDITARLDARPSLLVIDNAEHLPGIELEIAKLRIGKTALLVTSRSRLRLSGERELPLEPLPEDDALELFRARAAALGYAVPVDDVSRMICRRLDNLPLALELAAARLVVLSPVALLERLDRALPLLSDGPRDVDDRQRTLRATIEWSFRLLSGGGQRALRRLAAFRGGFTLDAARAVAGADIGLIAELADQSLIRRVGDDRYLMLETIREFGLEVEDADLAPAHAAYYLERVRANDREVRGPRMGALLAWQRSEAENIWAALDALVDGGREDDAWDLARLMHFYWQATGSVRRATEWLRRRLAQTESRTPAWIGASIALADLLDSLGSIDEARAVLDGVEAAALAAADARGLAGLHKVRHFVALSSRDLEAALAHAQVELEYARLLDERSRLFAEFHLAAALFELRQLEQAETILKPLLDAFASEGDLFNETGALHLLANVSFELGRYDAAAAYLDRTLRHLRTMDARGYLPVALTARGFYAMAQDRREEARRAFAEALSIAREDGVDYELCELVDHIAVLVATDDRPAAGSLYSTVGVRRAALGTPRLDRDLPIYAHVLGGAELVGDVIPWEDAISLAQSLVERSLD